MDTGMQNLRDLFQQLGLKHDDVNMRIFIATHHVPKGVPIAEAAFWTQSQSDFLRDSLEEDAEWAEAVDLLATMITAK